MHLQTVAAILAMCGAVHSLMRTPEISIFMRMDIDIVTCMYYTGLDPHTGEDVSTARHPSDRKLQRALLQFFKPENDFVGRRDLCGSSSPSRACEARHPRA